MIEGSATYFLTALFTASPLYLLWSAVLVYAFTKFAKNGKQAKIVAAVAVLSLMELLFSQIYYIFITRALWEALGGSAEYVTHGYSFARSIFHAALLAGLAYAVFSDRES